MSFRETARLEVLFLWNRNRNRMFRAVLPAPAHLTERQCSEYSFRAWVPVAGYAARDSKAFKCLPSGLCLSY